jgi:peroxiredoxin
MRKLLLCLLGGSFLVSCNQHPKGSDAKNNKDTVFVLAGKITGIDTGNIIFVHRENDEKVYDTAKIKGGVFEWKGHLPEPMIAYTAFIDGKQDKRVDVLMENAKMSFVANSDSVDKAVITGSGAQADYELFKKTVQPIDETLEAITTAYRNTEDKKVADSLDKEYEKYDSIKQAAVPGFVKEHAKSFAAPFLINRTLLIQPKPEILEQVYNVLDSAVKQSRYAKVIYDVLEAAKKTAIGQIAPDFTMNDVDGKPVTLSSLRGKYLLVDFWASWCGPCRRENPNVVKVYAKHHSSKFDILGVSLDSKQEEWKEAIKKDKLTWLHVSDLKGWGNAASKIYGIRAIPANVLLDKDGKIIARNIMGEELDKKLSEVLK